MNGHSQDPNFKFCTFCKGDTARRDNLRFTHWLVDKSTGKITCPFLLNTTCMVCLEKGHTSRNCRNQTKLDAMRMAAMSVGAESNAHTKLARMDLEEEIGRRRWAMVSVNEPKHCNFCANGKYNDGFFKTHNLHECPRLACMTCSVCGVMGHTQSKCPSSCSEGSGSIYSFVDGEVGVCDSMANTCGQFIFNFDEMDAEYAV